MRKTDADVKVFLVLLAHSLLISVVLFQLRFLTVLCAFIVREYLFSNRLRNWWRLQF